MTPGRCGTDAGYQRHQAAGEDACRACCDAHALDVANRRIAAHLPRPVVASLLYAACRAGRDVAEALSTVDRARLVTELHSAGWTDVEVAAHTRMTTFTAGEIRQRLGLAPNQPGATTSRGVA